MPASVVEIPGVGNVEFPDSMSDAEVSQAAHRLYTNAGAQAISQNPPGVQRPQVSPQFQNPVPTESIPVAGAIAQPFGEVGASLAYDPKFRNETAKYGAGSAAVTGGLAAGAGAGGLTTLGTLLAHPAVRKLAGRALEGAAFTAGGGTAYKYLKDLL
jgi:hypothetical protein